MNTTLLRTILAALLAAVLAFTTFHVAQSDPGTGVNVPSLAEHNALEARVTELEQRATAGDHEDSAQNNRLDALEAHTHEPDPTEEPTPTPTPTTTPTPTPTPTPNPATFPTRNSVGPAVEPTQSYNDCYIGTEQSGEVIDGKVIDCASSDGLRFAQGVQNVVIKNSVIKGQMLTIGSWAHDDQYPRVPTFTVEDSRIQQLTTAGNQDRATCCAHYVVKRSLIEGTHSGFLAHNNVTLEGNFITTNGTDSHSSGGRTLKNTVLRGNTITCKPVTPGSDGGCSAAAVFYSERIDGTSARAYNLTIENNYFRRGVTAAGAAGGPWFATRFIDCANRTDCTGITFTGNQFDLGWGTDGGEFPFYGGNVWSGNKWVDGQAAQSDTSR